MQESSSDNTEYRSENGATTWSSMNFSGYVGSVSVILLNANFSSCLVVGAGLGLVLT